MSVKRLWEIITALTLMLVSSVAFSQTMPIGFGNNFEFNQLTVNNGLSQNSVTSIVQDKNGFIWIGTYDGLNRFDGLQVINYRHQNNKAFDIPDNRILSLCVLDNGNVLVGTEGGGLAVYHQATEKFFSIGFEKETPELKTIVSISKTTNNGVWIATHKSAYYISHLDLNVKKQKIKAVNVPSPANINRLLCDSDNNLWMGTNQGLYFLSVSSSVPEKLADGNVLSIAQDRDNNIWYGGYGSLGVVKKQGDGIIGLPLLYEPLKTALFSVKNNLLISSITQDKSGNIWLTTDQNGVFACAMNSNGQFDVKEHYHSNGQYSPLPENNINFGFIDSTNTLWLGTFQNGISYNSLNQKNIYGFLPLIGAKKGKYITTLYANTSAIWIGTMDSGLWKYDLATGRYLPENGVTSRSVLTCFYNEQSKQLYVGGSEGLYVMEQGKMWRKLLNRTIRSICADRLGRLWLATWSGIIIYNPATQAVENITEKNGLSSDMGYVLLHDKTKNAVWYGTIGGGLNCISYNNGAISGIKKYQHQNNGNGLSSNHVWCLHQDKQGNVWAGTDVGLNRISPSQQISHIEQAGIKNSKITSITEDEDGVFWLGTGNGLAKYAYAKNSLKLYKHNDGLLSNTLTEAAFKMPNGAILVGTINGINGFFPKKIAQDQYEAKAAFTGLSVYGRTVNPGDTLNGRIILKENINTANELNLKHNQNNLSIGVAALHFAAPKANRIRYKLEGYDKNWTETEAGTSAITYSHLPAGDYKLLVNAANNDGLWSKHTKALDIHVSSSPWLSWWAKTIYLLIAVAIAWLIYRDFVSRKNMQQQIFLEKYEKEKMTELNELKLDFFTKITHDLRTPLSLIIGPTTDIAENVSNQSSYLTDRINIIRKNATRLLTLINQILDFRKIADGSILLNLKQDNLEEVVMETKNAFALLAETRHITFTVAVEKTDAETWIDREKLEKVLYNLISNAFNHTNDGGTISVKVNFKNQNQQLWANIQVADSGKGIDADELEHIFEMYYQGKNAGSKGSGIGLAVAKKLTELQNGQISVSSTLGKGTIFTVNIPLVAPQNGELTNNVANSTLENMVNLPVIGTTKNTILILEDEPDLLNYLADTLNALNDYHVIKAETAEAALALVKKQPPHLIISDLMLPDMDGLSFLKLIKNDAKTAHIPVIMHTVKYDRATIKQLMDSGADDFIPKPTNYGDLQRKVRNILATRQKLIENLHGRQLIDYTELPSANEDFLVKIIKCIEQNISNPDFSVEKLSSEMAMSRMNLHRKLDSMVGKTASELIREVRMKKAGQLLASGAYRISEVMFEVGISSNHYFNKYFKEMYGISAKEFIAKQK